MVSSERKIAFEGVSSLEAQIESFLVEHADGLRQESYEAKKALDASYLDVLVSLKEKWERKKVAANCEALLCEVMANINLLKIDYEQ